MRKGYWSPSNQVKASVANEYINMVNQYGVVCCHHTCANIVLNQWIVSLSTLNSAAIEKFKRTMAAAWGEDLPPGDTNASSTDRSGGHLGSETVSPGVTGSVGTGKSSRASGSGGISQSASESASFIEKGNAKAYEAAASAQGNSETTQMPHLRTHWHHCNSWSNRCRLPLANTHLKIFIKAYGILGGSLTHLLEFDDNKIQENLLEYLGVIHSFIRTPFRSQ
ncbi:MAG: Cobalamin biosynthesis protein N [Methanobacteriaceae archaeon 41_258]|nr:MAG: Cobalamin biosynthesis protein N [Methanobacteriaceae archaeon 41_258]